MGRKEMVDIASRSNSVDNVNKNYTTFFFYNFPNRYWARDMFDVFSNHVKVKKVVILARRDGKGRRFGFVRFFNVMEVERMAIFLDNIFVEGEKLYMNLPNVKIIRKTGPR